MTHLFLSTSFKPGHSEARFGSTEGEGEDQTDPLVRHASVTKEEDLVLEKVTKEEDLVLEKEITNVSYFCYVTY